MNAPKESLPTSAQKLKEMQKPMTFDVKHDRKFMVFLQEKFPLLLTLTQTIDSTGMALTLFIMTFRQMNEFLFKALRHFSAVGTILKAFNFIQIPLIYLTAFVLGEKIPFSLSKNAKWLYSAVLLGLALTSIFVPGAAVAIIIATAGLTLGASILTLANTLIKKQTQPRKLAEIRAKKEVLEQKAQALQLEAQALEQEGDGLSNAELDEKINALFKQHQALRVRLTKLYTDEVIYTKKITKKGTGFVLDRSVSTGLAAIGVIGSVLLLMAPVAGISVLAATSVVGTGYLALRMVGSLVNKLKKSPTTPTTKSSTSVSIAEGLTKNRDTDCDAPGQTFAHMTQELGGKAANLVKNTQVMHVAETLNIEIEQAVAQHDEQAMLRICHVLQTYYAQDKITEVELDEFINNLTDKERAWHMIARAINTASAETKSDLKKLFAPVLKQHHITFEASGHNVEHDAAVHPEPSH